MESLEVLPMDWTNTEQVTKVAAMHPFDLMLGSDLIYSEDRIEPLVRVIAALLEAQERTNSNPRPTFLYGHTLGRMSDLDLLWEKELEAQGLEWRLLRKVPQWGDRMTVIMEIQRCGNECGSAKQ